MLVIIDNYDSFTYNIVQTVAANGLKEGRTEDIRVFRNDKITVQEIEALAAGSIVDLSRSLHSRVRPEFPLRRLSILPANCRFSGSALAIRR